MQLKKKKPIAKQELPKKKAVSSSREIALPKKQEIALKKKDLPRPIEDDEESEDAVRLLPGVSKTTLRRINTMFGQRSDTIIELLEANDTDPAAALITRTLLQTLVDVLPVVERGVRKSKGTRGVVPLNHCISQIREIIHDLHAFKDRSLLGQNLVDRNIRPAYLDLAVQVSNLFLEQENYIRTRLGKDDFDSFQTFNSQLKRSIADFIRKQYEELSSSIVKSV